MKSLSSAVAAVIELKSIPVAKLLIRPPSHRKFATSA